MYVGEGFKQVHIVKRGSFSKDGKRLAITTGIAGKQEKLSIRFKKEWEKDERGREPLAFRAQSRANQE